MTLAALCHGGHEAHDQADAAEIVQLHGAFEIVEAVVAGFQRTADGATGIVDQDVHVAVVVQHLLHQPVAVRHVGQVGGVGEHLATRLLHGIARLEQFFLATGNNDRRSARLGHALRGGQADTRRTTGDHYHLVAHLALERAVDEKVRVQVAVPVIPKAPCIRIQPWHRDATAFQCTLGFAAVETRGIGDELQHFLGNLEVAQHHADETPHRRQVADRATDAAGHEGEHACVHAHGHFRRMAGTGEGVQHLADAHGFRVGQVEGVPVQLGLVRDVVHGIRHEIHRH